jgi:hypothetical protein
MISPIDNTGYQDEMVRCFVCKNRVSLSQVTLVDNTYPVCSRDRARAESVTSPDGRFELVLVG